MIGDLYQIGVPVERLSTVFLLWDSYERPCKLLISPAKTEGMAVVEFRHTLLAAEIVKTLPESKVHILDQPIKTVKL